MAECPSVRELLDNVKSLTRQQDGTFQTAWSDSFVDAFHCCEQGGFIYVDFPVPDRLTRAFISRAPKGDTMNQRTEGPNAAIDLNKPGIGMDNVILVANFHTHPLSAQVGGDPQPSRADQRNAYDRGVPGIVISRGGIYSYGPERREDKSNPKGYAPPVSQGSRVTPEKQPPPPWTVPNQWPEGTGSQAVADAIISFEVMTDNKVEEGEVIYVEWSDNGVVHGEPLIESED